MTCVGCQKETTITVDVGDKRYCFTCFDPFRMCKKCRLGQVRSCPTPNWMNRHKCDKCGKYSSK